jgi:biopolymer transport protein ExbD
MLRRRRSAGAPHGELNVIPLIDVVFFLLVFYVIASSFTQDRSVPVDRPASAGAAPSTGTAVVVGVLQDGAVQLGGQALPLVGLTAALRVRLAESGSQQVLVVADRTLPTGRLLAVMDACRAAGAARVEVAAERTAP